MTIWPSTVSGTELWSGRMIAWGGTPVGALLGGVLAELLPTRVIGPILCQLDATGILLEMV